MQTLSLRQNTDHLQVCWKSFGKLTFRVVDQNVRHISMTIVHIIANITVAAPSVRDQRWTSLSDVTDVESTSWYRPVLSGWSAPKSISFILVCRWGSILAIAMVNVVNRVVKSLGIFARPDSIRNIISTNKSTGGLGRAWTSTIKCRFDN